MAGSLDDDEDSVLDESEQTNRPTDTAFSQQRIQAWHPILDPVWVIIALFYLGVIMVPTGFKIDSLQKNVVELKTKYDGILPKDQVCGIGGEFNANRTCFLMFTAPRYMRAPILIHYELTNFHQNHRSYYDSRDDFQLHGRVGNQDSVSRKACQPLNKLGNKTLNPCGLAANTMFNDFFTLESGRDINRIDLEMLETGIAWKSDIEYMYRQPEGFEYAECEANACDSTCCERTTENGEQFSCGAPYFDRKTDKCFAYHYPLQDETQYLYETYPDVISPIEGVTNEHFVVWMRIATQPTFRKLYGWIDQDIPAGETLRFRVNANYVVTRFQGSKSLLISTNNIFGGRNPYFGSFFFWVGIFCLAAGTFFAFKHAFRPRRLGDGNYLHYKDD